VLIQAGADDRPFGFRTEPVDGSKRIVDLGGYPSNVRKIDASVTLRSGAVGDAEILDGNGYGTARKAESARREDGLTVMLPEDSLYTLVQ
jgi:hypothetical protein